MFRNRWLIALGAIATAFVLVSADAQARVGGGFSGGSRGTRTFSAPPATPTALSAAPIQRSITQPGNAAPIGQTGMRSGLFGGGLFGGLAAGFLGAGLFGLLFGHGFFGGMAGFASIIGLLLQVVLVVIVARLIFAWWQRRNMPAPAYAAAHPGWAAPMYRRPATILPSPSRTMMRLNDCSGISKPTIRRKTFWPCAQR
jgi:predicted lipid-binding transport protein (Tim44 family)